MNMGYDEFSMKLGSIPESEPLYTIFKSRSINIGKIKDKDEKINQLIEQFNLSEIINKRAKTLSGGWKKPDLYSVTQSA